MNRPHFMSADTGVQALCLDRPEDMFVFGAAQNDIKAICQACPIRTECLATALDGRYEFGVWGGMTERERRALLRRRPNVRDWHELLTQARDSYTCQPMPRITQP
jgi:WhiB family transcriptional regulator, redox-sensing transcriptional regulator